MSRAGAQHSLEESWRQLAAAQRIAEIGSFEYDVLSGRLTGSAELYRIVGVEPDRAPSIEMMLAIIFPEDRALCIDAYNAIVERGTGVDVIIRIIRADLEESWVHCIAVAEMDDAGAVMKVVGTLRNNTGRMLAVRAEKEAVARFEVAFEQAVIGAAIIDLDGRAVRVNAAVCTLLGRPASELLGRDWDEYNYPDNMSIGDVLLARSLPDSDSYSDERRFVRPDESIVWAALHIVLVRDESGKPNYQFAQFQNITEQKRIEAELAHLALHDSLTGLANRALLADRLSHGLAGARRRGSRLGVIFLDLDHFSAVNETLGHTAGDKLLKHTVDRIAAVIRRGDTVARFGTDEFVIVCEDISVPEAEKVAHRLLDAVSQPFLHGDHEITVTASMGIVLADEHSTPESLLRDSDAAMYAAKARGRNRFEFFDQNLRVATDRRLATAAALRHAMSREEFAVHYQPVVDLTTGELVSAEALLRWRNPELGIINPDEFIPLAEESGLIVPLGAWVLEQACLQLVEWQRINPAMSVAVNLSTLQLNTSDIAEVIADVVRGAGARPESVCLELTESVFMAQTDYFRRTLAEIKSLGITLSIDDFGTGYSSLSYLKDFPVDSVKIDRAFVAGLGDDPQTSALIAAIIAMADALGLGVTAEGIETHDQLMILRRLKCARAQGFFLARPMPADGFKSLLARSHRWRLD